ncbi:hypothetical protein ScPMuIL_012138 [Solemya velum]
MAAVFRKPKRNFRKKVTESDSDHDDSGSRTKENDNEDSNDSIDISEIVSKLKERKKKKDKDQAPSLLSFGDADEEEGEVFKVKKSSHSKRLAKQLKKTSLKVKDIDEQIGQTDVKDDNDNDKGAEDMDIKEEDAEEKLARLREEFRTLNGDEAARMEESDEEEDGEKVFKAMLKRGEIPDATTIHMIRKKRQQARELGDFIPVDDTVQYENEKSRLVREDDNDKSEDEEEGRIDFSVNTEVRDRMKRETDFYATEHGSDREESDHEREWEEQQIRKGVSVQQPNLPEGINLEQITGPMNQRPFSNGYPNYCDEKQTFQPLTILSQDPSQITIEAIKRLLKERLESMNEVHRAHEREMASACTTADETEKSIETCEDKTEGLENQYRFFQEMRGYVRDLVECLDEKVPTINDLETRMWNLLKNRSQKMTNRRQQDVRDQCQAYMTSKAKVVMESSEDQAKQRRVAEREARRSRRRRARENKQIIGHHDGLSSDDEENQSDITKFNMENDTVTSIAGQLFEDVVEEFSGVDYSRRKFQEWKNLYCDSYKEAYIGLCLPRLFNPFIRLSLLNWNPLEEQCQDFEDLSWYETLVHYGFEDEESICKDDDDIKLLPLIVEKIILPKLNNLAEFVWDPMSTTQTVRLVNLLHKLIKDYPTVHANSKNTQILLNRIVQRMKKTLDDDVFMPLYPKNVLENRSSGPAVFFHRQSWICIKLLGNIMSWVGIISDDILQRLAFDGLLNRYIILGLQTSGFSPIELLKCQAIVSTFPKQWFSQLEGNQTLPQLENVCRYLMFAAVSLERCSFDQKDSEKKEIRDQLKQIVKLLVNMNAVDHASDLSDKYSIKM